MKWSHLVNISNVAIENAMKKVEKRPDLVESWLIYCNALNNIRKEVIAYCDFNRFPINERWLTLQKKLEPRLHSFFQRQGLAIQMDSNGACTALFLKSTEEISFSKKDYRDFSQALLELIEEKVAANFLKKNPYLFFRKHQETSQEATAPNLNYRDFKEEGEETESVERGDPLTDSVFYHSQTPPHFREGSARQAWKSVVIMVDHAADLAPSAETTMGDAHEAAVPIPPHVSVISRRLLLEDPATKDSDGFEVINVPGAF